MNEVLASEQSERQYRKNILEAMFVSSLSNPDSEFLSGEKFALSEATNGAIEYIMGHPGRILFKSFRLRGKGFEVRSFDEFESEMEAHPNILSPKIERALYELFKPYSENPAGADHSFKSTELYEHYKWSYSGGICPGHLSNYFAMPEDTILRVQDEIIPSLSEAERKDVVGIGGAMRKYIDTDLKFLKETSYRS